MLNQVQHDGGGNLEFSVETNRYVPEHLSTMQPVYTVKHGETRGVQSNAIAP
jgi:hypothetical protein